MKIINTKILGKRIDYYRVIDSTHLKAKSLKDEEIENGMIILTDEQTAGIGTHGRKWYTENSKNLCFDIILLPNCKLEKIEHLTVLIAECIVKTLDDLYKISADIEAPNDIMLNGKKMAGILTESISTGDIVKKIYIGIGINVNQEKFDKEIENIATSLRREFSIEFSRENILNKFLEIFEERLIYCDIIERRKI